MSVDNVLEVYGQATDRDLEARAWYQSAHTFCVGLSKRYDVKVSTAAAVVAALSPQLHWPKNMAAADLLLRTGDKLPGVLGESFHKAAAIAEQNDPECGFWSPRYQRYAPALSGPKVRSFYANMLRPNESGPVTIDTHAYAVVAGHNLTKTEASSLSNPKRYNQAADDYRQAAAIVGMRPHELQAITWTVWKRIKTYERPQHVGLYQRKAA